MADSIKVEVTPDKSEQMVMKDSVSRDSQSNLEEITKSLSDLSRRDAGEIQNSEKVILEEMQSQSSEFASGLSIIVSTKSDNLQQKQINTPSRCLDKALEDGYNWRKYGQKLVKGNEFIRSYYKCTHPNCRAKRQVERSQAGKITDTVYIDKHEHVKSQPRYQATVYSALPIQSIQPDARTLVAEEGKSVDGEGPTSKSHEVKPAASPKLVSTTPAKNVLNDSNHDCDSPVKRQKTDICDVDKTPVEKPYVEPRSAGEERVVVQTMSAVDVLQDGYRWRKYGQKLVKGSPHPRSYYRCSSPGCLMKKHVERASHDPKAVITTYDGQHNHDMPPARTFIPVKGRASANSTSIEDKTSSKPEEKPATGLDLVVHIRSN